jgi:hypothetical protein
MDASPYRSGPGSTRHSWAWAVACVAVLATCSTARAQEPAEAELDDRLVCIGALAASHVYTTYGYVGGVADGYASETYDGEKVRDLMREVVNLGDTNVRLLKKVREGNIVEGDKRVVDEIIAVYGLLKQEAESLAAYAQSDDQADLDAFEAARKAAWPKIKALLGIK